MSKRGRRPNKQATRLPTSVLLDQAAREPGGKEVVIATDVTELMNGYERDYLRTHIEPRIQTGELLRWRYEGLAFRLGYQCHYTPDFVLTFADGRMEIHEVKGRHIEDDARVKLKTFVSIWPDLPLYLAQRLGKTWTVERVKGGKWRGGVA